MTLSIDLEERVCRVERAAASTRDANVVLSCRLDPIRDALLRSRSDQPQAELLLPPVRMPAARRRKRA
jgi:hypothetical protein